MLQKMECISSFKRFGPISTCHRNWKAALNMNRDSTKCSFIHGYSRYIDFKFSSYFLDEQDWVMDFGDLKAIKNWLDVYWDHAVIVSSDDPKLEFLKQIEQENLIKLTILPEGYTASLEGNCQWVYDSIMPLLSNKTPQVWISSIRIYEHENNYVEKVFGSYPNV